MKRLEMITMRLGDLDKLKQELILDYAYAAADIVDSQPTIEPENLPVVKELREQLEAEKNKVVKIQYDCEEMTIKQICDRLRYAEQKLEEVTAERDSALELIGWIYYEACVSVEHDMRQHIDWLKDKI